MRAWQVGNEGTRGGRHEAGVAQQGVVGLLLDVDRTWATEDKLLTPRAKGAVTPPPAGGIVFVIMQRRALARPEVDHDDLGAHTVAAGFNGRASTTLEPDVGAGHGSWTGRSPSRRDDRSASMI